MRDRVAPLKKERSDILSDWVNTRKGPERVALLVKLMDIEDELEKEISRPKMKQRKTG